MNTLEQFRLLNSQEYLRQRFRRGYLFFDYLGKFPLGKRRALPKPPPIKTNKNCFIELI